MAQKRGERLIKSRIEFVGLAEGEATPDLAVRIADSGGKVIDTAEVGEDGAFQISAAALDKSARVLIGPSDADLSDRAAFRSYDTERFLSVVEAGIAISKTRWSKWLQWTRCVGGSVRRCYPKPWIIDILASRIEPIPSLARLDPLGRQLREPARAFMPFFPKCSPVCHGVVEVYRRRCCCQPIVVFDPRIPEIIRELEEFPPIPFPEPDPPPIPIPLPDPDPVPWDRLNRVVTGGAVDTRKLNATRDLAALKILGPAEQVAYLNARRYLWCSCGLPSKVAEGTIQGNGTYDICWREPIVLQPSHCHDEVAYVVKQPRFGTMVTIYDGVASHQWFGPNDEPVLTSYSPLAVGCKEPVVPGTGAFVVLQDIGDTESHRLSTPSQDGVFSVSSPVYNSGLLDPVASPADALGKNRNRNLGGTVRLRYEFTDGMHALGAVYYRVGVAPANSTGDPTGPFEPLPAPQWKYWHIATGVDGTHSLGPVTKGTETNLYVIPFDGIAPLGGNDEWHDGQYHAVLDTAAKTEGRYLVTVEVFDKDGNLLRPTGAGGGGTEKPFTFRRWSAPGTTNAVPYAALTHMLWWDNRKAVAIIADIRKGVVASSDQCQFLTGKPWQKVSVGYRAFHPKPDTLQPGFVLSHTLKLRRGLAGPSWNIEQDTGVNVGGPGAVLAHVSQEKTFAELLAPPPAGLKKCAFSLVLNVVTKTTNGEGHSVAFDATDQAAFAAEVTP
ncbi:MAG TPA: hypothetical protein VJ482_05970 [Acidimicrobiia bacterium]|nr:hypothetical protein [Acidimicrobiia bacterium]